MILNQKIYAVRGPSGIGKTTVLNMIAGLRKADESYYRSEWAITY